MKLFNIFLFLITTHCLQAMDQPSNVFNDKEIYDFLPALTDTTLPATPTKVASSADVTLHTNATHLKRKLFQDESEYIPAAALPAESLLVSEYPIGSGLLGAYLPLEKEDSAKLPEKPRKTAKETLTESHPSNTFKCQFCDYSTYLKGNLTLHQNRNHKTEIYKELNDPNFKKEVLCPRHPECPQTFMNVQDYCEHIRIYNHTAFSAGTILRNTANARSYEPVLIPNEPKPKESATHDTPALNTASVIGRPRLACPALKCPYNTPEYDSLKSHILCRHTNIRPFICPDPECKKGFNTNSNLHTHAQRVHPGLRIQPPSQEAKVSIKKALAPFLKTFSQKEERSKALSKKES